MSAGLPSIPANRRILIADDHPDIHADFRKLLVSSQGAASAELARLQAALFNKKAAAEAESFELDFAHQGDEALAKVKAALAAGRPYAAAFVDMRMPPGWDGLRTIQEIWRVDPELQIVVCTAYSDQPWEGVEAVARGTDRLLVLKKPFDGIEVKQLAASLAAKWRLGRQAALRASELEHLVAQRTAELERLRQMDHQRVEQLQQAVERRTAELRQAATHDDLTGLPNRALFHDRLAQALALGSRRAGILVAVLFIDFDRFKVVNDSLGHEAGDRLLRSIAQRLSHTLRDTDTMCLPECEMTASRLGGDEFCVLLTGLRHREDAGVVAKRILDSLEKPHDLSGRVVTCSASIGIAISSAEGDSGACGEPTESAESMIRDADNAMYRAKAAGRGRFVMFDRAMHEEAMSRLTVEHDLHCALEREEFATYFQPVISLVSGEVVGTEALVRWNHPQRGRIYPEQFIKIAEETGVIDKLGLWVLEDACRRMAHWRSSIPSACQARLNVNVAKRQLDDPRFPDSVEVILRQAGLAPDALALEITESALMTPTPEVRETLARFREMGVRVFLDDFGTGFSSLSVLHSFPLDGLKIDRSFVVDSSGHRRFAAIIHTIMSLVHNLGMEGVAEGVESMEHVALLQSLGCVKGQGYLFSPALRADEMEAMFRKNVRSWILPTGNAA